MRRIADLWELSVEELRLLHKIYGLTGYGNKELLIDELEYHYELMEKEEKEENDISRENVDIISDEQDASKLLSKSFGDEILAGTELESEAKLDLDALFNESRRHLGSFFEQRFQSVQIDQVDKFQKPVVEVAKVQDQEFQDQVNSKSFQTFDPLPENDIFEEEVDAISDEQLAEPEGETNLDALFNELRSNLRSCFEITDVPTPEKTFLSVPDATVMKSISVPDTTVVKSTAAQNLSNNISPVCSTISDASLSPQFGLRGLLIADDVFIPPLKQPPKHSFHLFKSSKSILKENSHFNISIPAIFTTKDISRLNLIASVAPHLVYPPNTGQLQFAQSTATIPPKLISYFHQFPLSLTELFQYLHAYMSWLLFENLIIRDWFLIISTHFPTPYTSLFDTYMARKMGNVDYDNLDGLVAWRLFLLYVTRNAGLFKLSIHSLTQFKFSVSDLLSNSFDLQ